MQGGAATARSKISGGGKRWSRWFTPSGVLPQSTNKKKAQSSDAGAICKRGHPESASTRRKGRGGAVEIQVIESYLTQEGETLKNLWLDIPNDGSFPA